MVQSQVKDIFSLIEADHRKAEALLADLESAKNKEALKIFSELYKELNLHAKVEEYVFYPAMREYEEAAQHIEEAESEHNSVEILLEQMRNLKPGDEEFQIKLKYLKDSISHHVEEEESEIFEVVRKVMKPQQLQALGEQFLEAKTRLTEDVEAALER